MNKIILYVFASIVVAACYTGVDSEPVLNDGPKDLVSLLQGKLLAPNGESNEYKLATGVGDVLASIITFFLRIAGFFISPIIGVIVNIFESLTLDKVPLFDLGHTLLVAVQEYFSNVAQAVLEAAPKNLAGLLEGQLLTGKEESGTYNVATGVGDVLVGIINIYLRIVGFFTKPLAGVIINIFEMLSLHRVPALDLYYILLLAVRDYFLNFDKSS